MISFRFHVVSITAVFLAIAIGVRGRARPTSTAPSWTSCGTGSTRCRKTSTTRKAENDALERELGDARGYIDAQRRLRRHRPAHRRARARRRRAGRRRGGRRAHRGPGAAGRRASSPGVVWLEPQWASRATTTARRSPTIVDADATDDAARTCGPRPGTAVADELGRRSAARDGTATTDDRRRRRRPRCSSLIEAGFLVRRRARRRPRRPRRPGRQPAPRVLVAHRRAGRGRGRARRARSWSTPRVDAGLGHRRRRRATSRRPRRPERGEALVDAARRRRSREPIALVDDADLIEGRVAAVLALDAAADGEVGHTRVRRRRRRGRCPRGHRRDRGARGRRPERDPFGRRHGRGGGGVAGLRRAADGRHRGRPRHDLPRQHVPGLQQRVERALRAAGRRAPSRPCSSRPSSTTSAAASERRAEEVAGGVLSLALVGARRRDASLGIVFAP